MKVPAFGWPPRFFNQGAQYFVALEGDGTLIGKSPNVVSSVRVGVGLYETVLDKPNSVLVPVVFAQRAFYLADPIDPVTWSVQTFNPANNPQDYSHYLLLFAVPEKWVAP
jgi:hypothetical protein